MKTKEELLKAYKKANYIRRSRILEKEGYVTEKEYLSFLTSAGKKKEKTKKKKEKGSVQDMVIAFDTTGSMSPYIENVKKHVETLIPELFSKNPDLRIKIVAFGDYCDMTGEGMFGKAYQESKLTNNQQELINFVKKAKNTNGGDSDEFYELVIKKIVEETPWRTGSKSILLIGDANPHYVGYSYSTMVVNNQISWKEEAYKALGKGIKIDTLAINPFSTWYEELSKITKGVHMPFQSSHKMNEVVGATTYVRGSRDSKIKFREMYKSAVATNDLELIGVYTALSSEL